MEPLTLRPTLLIAKYTRIKPNHITVLGFILNITSVIFFFHGTSLSLILVALLFEASLILDYVDGTLARLTNSVSEFGRKLDFLSGCLYTNFALLALLISQWLIKGDVPFFLIGLIYIILNDTIHFGFLQAHAPDNPVSVTSGEYIKTKPLTFLIGKYVTLKNFFGRFRLTAFPTEIDTINIILFLSPLFGFLFWGLLFGLVTISVQFIMIFLIIVKERKRNINANEGTFNTTSNN